MREPEKKYINNSIPLESWYKKKYSKEYNRYM